jgi:hypothetical protein
MDLLQMAASAEAVRDAAEYVFENATPAQQAYLDVLGVDTTWLFETDNEPELFTIAAAKVLRPTEAVSSVMWFRDYLKIRGWERRHLDRLLWGCPSSELWEALDLDAPAWAEAATKEFGGWWWPDVAQDLAIRLKEEAEPPSHDDDFVRYMSATTTTWSVDQAAGLLRAAHRDALTLLRRVTADQLVRLVAA